MTFVRPSVSNGGTGYVRQVAYLAAGRGRVLQLETSECRDTVPPHLPEPPMRGAEVVIATEPGHQSRRWHSGARNDLGPLDPACNSGEHRIVDGAPAVPEQGGSPRVAGIGRALSVLRPPTAQKNPRRRGILIVTTYRQWLLELDRVSLIHRFLDDRRSVSAWIGCGPGCPANPTGSSPVLCFLGLGEWTNYLWRIRAFGDFTCRA